MMCVMLADFPGQSVEVLDAHEMKRFTSPHDIAFKLPLPTRLSPYSIILYSNIASRQGGARKVFPGWSTYCKRLNHLYHCAVGF